MKPVLQDGQYVFCTFPKPFWPKPELKPLLIFTEEEGVTLILKKQVADENKFSYYAVWGLITLTVHSDLETIGFLAAVSSALGRADISVNAVSAYYHDHLFVPFGKRERAMKVLKEIK